MSLADVLPVENENQIDSTDVTDSVSKPSEELSLELNIPYTVLEVLVAIMAIIGNAMVICVFQRERRLRRRTNYYIVSLALADLLVGLLGIPFAILASVGLPKNLYACLFTVSLLVVLCTISIFCLVAVSVDRYWAILYPLAYSRNVRTRTAIVIITFCWVLGSIVGFLPLMGWHDGFEENLGCYFVEVMDYNYLVFLYFATIITPAILLLAFYAHIYTVIIKQVKQTVTINASGITRNTTTGSIHRIALPESKPQSGTMLRVLGAARKREVKATQNLSIIVLFFMICWLPLYTINCVKAFCPDCYVSPALTFFAIILSHLNSAVNPLLYAYHLKDFRAALKALILKLFGKEGQPPEQINYRFSLASQHKLNSILEKRATSLHPRIYIDSPVWLRQQNQRANTEVPPSSPITCSPNNVHQTIAAVASATDDDSSMWKVMEIVHANNSECNQSQTGSSSSKSHPIGMVRSASSPYMRRKSGTQSQRARENIGFIPDENTIYEQNEMFRQYLSTELPFHNEPCEPDDGLPLSHMRLQKPCSSSNDIHTTDIDDACNYNRSPSTSGRVHFDNPIFSIEEASKALRAESSSSTNNSPKKINSILRHNSTSHRNYLDEHRIRSRASSTQRSPHLEQTQLATLKRSRSNFS